MDAREPRCCDSVCEDSGTVRIHAEAHLCRTAQDDAVPQIYNNMLLWLYRVTCYLLKQQLILIKGSNGI
jgi:hypothetical protein